MRTLLYNRVKCYGHPRADSSGNVLEHIIVAEKALGKLLDRRHEVHHVNENKTENRNDNLVICEDKEYHHLLHMRRKAKQACGDPSYRKCVRCKCWDSPANLRPHTKGRSGHTFYHKECAAKYGRTA